MNNGGVTSSLGFGLGVANNFNPWLGVTLEAGANFDNVGVLGFTVLDGQGYPIVAGPKFTLRTADRVAPFGQLLAGVTDFRGNLLGIDVDCPSSDDLRQGGA